MTKQNKSLIIHLIALFVFTIGYAQKPDSKPYQKINPVTPFTPQAFANPSATEHPWVRWNFPPATAEIPQLEIELEQLHEAGIAGVEIGQGGEPTLEQLKAILTKVNALGMAIGLKYKTGNPTAGSFSPTHDYVRKNLASTDVIVHAGVTFNDSIPGKGTILAVQAYRLIPSSPADPKILALDRSSLIDLTSTITNKNTKGFFGGSTTGRVTWTAPGATSTSDWVLIAFRIVLEDPQPEVFSLEGTNLLIKGFESYWTDEIKNLLKKNVGGDIFIDSHSTDGFGAPNELWSSNMAQEFKKRTGYDLIPYLPALIAPAVSNGGRGRGGAAPPVEGKHSYTFNDNSKVRVLADFNQVRSDMFIEYRIKPFTTWTHKYNLTLRLQPEDISVINTPDQIAVTYYLERPEHETLIGGDQIDVYRPMASAIHMNGNTWFSTELGAALSLNYAQTFQDIVVRMNKGFAAGQTKGVYHVYPHGFSPTSVWPGYNSFAESGFSNSWGPRNPIWLNEAKTINNWMARNELVLKQGSVKIDVAVYMHNFSFPAPFGGGDGNERYWKDLTLQEAGYTWDYLNPTLLTLPNAKVTNHLLAEEGPSYKALILDGFLQSVSIHNPAKNTLTIDAAKKILNFAQSGLPVIVVGELPNRTPGNTPKDDKILKDLLDQLLKQKSVVRASTETDVPKVLQSLHIEPAAKPEAPSHIMSMRRYSETTNTNYYFLYNQGEDQLATQGATKIDPKFEKLSRVPRNLFEETKTIRTKGLNPGTLIGTALDKTITLEGKGMPFLLNTWSGEITPIVDYKSDANHVSLNIKLESDESVLIGITQDLTKFGINGATVHVNHTEADGASQTSNGSIEVFASTAGTYATQLSNGQTVNAIIDQVPAKIDLTNAAWKLKVEDWQPKNEYGTTGKPGIETKKQVVELTLESLKAWPDIASLANTSGVGTYSTSIVLPADWNNSTHGAVLDLGQVVDAFNLTINNNVVVCDQVGAIADVSKFLKPGSNEIVVRVSTTLNNRLVVLNKGVADRDVIQEYGLVGPVILKPYKKKIVWSK